MPTIPRVFMQHLFSVTTLKTSGIYVYHFFCSCRHVYRQQQEAWRGRGEATPSNRGRERARCSGRKERDPKVSYGVTLYGFSACHDVVIDYFSPLFRLSHWLQNVHVLHRRPECVSTGHPNTTFWTGVESHVIKCAFIIMSNRKPQRKSVFEEAVLLL